MLSVVFVRQSVILYSHWGSPCDHCPWCHWSVTGYMGPRRPWPCSPDMLKLVQLGPHHVGSPSPGHVQLDMFKHTQLGPRHTWTPHAHTRLAGKRTVDIRLKCLLLVLVYLKLRTKILFRYCYFLADERMGKTNGTAGQSKVTKIRRWVLFFSK